MEELAGESSVSGPGMHTSYFLKGAGGLLGKEEVSYKAELTQHQPGEVTHQAGAWALGQKSEQTSQSTQLFLAEV